jgi:hypothetical protein
MTPLVLLQFAHNVAALPLDALPVLSSTGLMLSLAKI